MPQPSQNAWHASMKEPCLPHKQWDILDRHMAWRGLLIGDRGSRRQGFENPHTPQCSILNNSHWGARVSLLQEFHLRRGLRHAVAGGD